MMANLLKSGKVSVRAIIGSLSHSNSCDDDDGGMKISFSCFLSNRNLSSNVGKIPHAHTLSTERW